MDYRDEQMVRENPCGRDINNSSSHLGTQLHHSRPVGLSKSSMLEK